MSTAATEQGAILFVSYSRQDSFFVDTLDLDLRQRGFMPWVDRDHLEGGDLWQQTIEAVIRRSAGMLFVQPPASANLEWVRREIQYARDNGKVIIPIRIRQEGNANLLAMNLENWVDFSESYGQGMEGLVTSVYQRVLFLDQPNSPKVEKLIVTTPAPNDNANNPRLEALFLAAQNADDLEQKNKLLERILAQDRTFRHNRAQTEWELIQPELHRERLRRAIESAEKFELAGDWRQAAGAWQLGLQEDPENVLALAGVRRALQNVAESAYRIGYWEEELNAWQEILGFLPDDTLALYRLPIAKANSEWAPDYHDAVVLCRSGNKDAARKVLEDVWLHAPFYRDPEGIASELALPLPPSFEELEQRKFEETKQAEEARKAEETRRKTAAMFPKVKLRRTGVTTSRVRRKLFGNKPSLRPPDVSVPRTSLSVGEPFIIQWDIEVSRPVKIKRIKFSLTCTEEVRYYVEREYRSYDSESGSYETKTAYDPRALRVTKIVSQSALEVGSPYQRGQQLTGQQMLAVPSFVIHTVKEDPYTVRWNLNITVECEPNRDSIAATYEFEVLPKVYEW